MEVGKETILLHDTSIMSGNRGDDIIMNAVKTELGNLFPYCYFINIPTHDYPSTEAKLFFEKVSLSFVGGTNLLSGNMDIYNQWKLVPEYINPYHEVVLMGVGWWQYQKDINTYTAELLRKVLSKKIFHSVRDEYTKKKLNSIGIMNVINTGCPTLWRVKNPIRMAGHSENVIFTLTDYSKRPEQDKIMIDILRRKYKNLYFWIQGTRDYSYLRELCLDQMNDIHIIPPTLQAYDDFLNSHQSIDYVGTRLHAGIRAMQYGISSLIVSIDNRAREMGRDLNLPIIKRDEIDRLEEILQPQVCEKILTLPTDQIESWCKQFSETEYL